MTLEEKITYQSQGITGSLNGRIQLDEGRGRFVVNDESGYERTVQDIDGFKSYNPSIGEVVRTGRMPDNSYGFVSSKEGSTVQDIFQ